MTAVEISVELLVSLNGTSATVVAGGILLDDHCPADGTATRSYVTDLELGQITASELAIHCKIE